MTIIPDEIKPQKRVLFRVTMSKEALEEVEAYCQWRGISISKSHFSEHAMKYVIREDKNWLACKNGNIPAPVEPLQTPFKSRLDSNGFLE